MIVMHRTWPIPAVWVILLACGLSVIAPGMTSGREGPVVLEPDGDGVQRTVVILDSYALTPGHLRVRAGVPVELRLENRSFLTPHNVIIDSPVEAMRHNVHVGAGTSVMLRFLPETPGTYTLYCDKQLLFFPSHREKGMEGRLDVR